MARIARLIRDDEGATSVEYAVMLSLIAGAVIASVLAMSNAAADNFQNSAEQLDAVM